MKSIILSDAKVRESVYSPKVLAKMDISGLDKTFYTKADILACPEKFIDVEYIFSTWGMPVFTEEEIKALLPSLKCVFYAAGTVQGFARPFLNLGIKVFSAWVANGISVAEFTVAQIILASKGFFTLSAHLRNKDWETARRLQPKYPGNVDEKIGIIGCGTIGTSVVELLKPYSLEVLVYDPFLSDERASELGVTKSSLEEIFSSCSVISNHIANKKETENMFRYEHFSSMRPYSTFINTGRGAQVVEDDLVRVLKERPDVTALLDVTNPEPSPLDHPFYTLPNCFMSPHIAGCTVSGEQARMVYFMVDEYNRYVNNEPTKYEITKGMLERLA